MVARITRLMALLVLLVSSGACAQAPPEGATAGVRQSASAGEAPTVAGAIPSWAGRYEFIDRAGETVGGTGVVTTYRLDVPREASSPGTLKVTGFQSDTTVNCELSATPADVSVKFLSYADGRTVNEFGVAVYQPHQVLFTLRRGPGGRVATTWQALRPDGVREPSGPYFEKTDAISR
jgi:hypothetical protein